MKNIEENILITNDDGIDSIGIKYLTYLVSKLVNKEKIYIIAPLTQRSGISKAFSFKIKTEKISEKPYILGIDGTPADAVLISLEKISNIDIIFSGFNLGPNIGIEDVLSSGTVGAAIEGALHGIKSISLSLVAEKWEEYKTLTLEKLHHIDKWSIKILSHILLHKLPNNIDILNINFPLKNIKGIKITRLGKNVYRNLYVEKGNILKVRGWHLELYEEENTDTDIIAVKEGYISITPITISKILINEIDTATEYFENII